MLDRIYPIKKQSRLRINPKSRDKTFIIYDCLTFGNLSLILFILILILVLISGVGIFWAVIEFQSRENVDQSSFHFLEVELKAKERWNLRIKISIWNWQKPIEFVESREVLETRRLAPSCFYCYFNGLTLRLWYNIFLSLYHSLENKVGIQKYPVMKFLDASTSVGRSIRNAFVPTHWKWAKMVKTGWETVLNS